MNRWIARGHKWTQLVKNNYSDLFIYTQVHIEIGRIRRWLMGEGAQLQSCRFNLHDRKCHFQYNWPQFLKMLFRPHYFICTLLSYSSTRSTVSAIVYKLKCVWALFFFNIQSGSDSQMSNPVFLFFNITPPECKLRVKLSFEISKENPTYIFYIVQH